MASLKSVHQRWVFCGLRGRLHYLEELFEDSKTILDTTEAAGWQSLSVSHTDGSDDIFTSQCRKPSQRVHILFLAPVFPQMLDGLPIRFI